MSVEENQPTAEDKRDRIEVLLHELYSREDQVFLEIQFDSPEVVYQSHRGNHNAANLTTTRRDAMQDIVDEYNLEIIFEESGVEHTVMTASHDTGVSAEEHIEVTEDILTDVYGVSFEDVTLAFLSSRLNSPEPLLWTDVETE